jgi:hypothetical protein
MGARDLSIINTPPPNRQPVLTEIIQYNEIKNLSAEERDARYSQSLTDQQTALDAKNASRLPGPTTVTRTEEPNTTATTVTEIQPKTAAETTPLSGAIPGTNVSTANVDGTTYQTVANADGTTSYTNENTGTSTTINDSSASDKKTVDENTNGRPLTLDEIIQAKAALRAGGGNNNEDTGTTKKFITDEDGQTNLVAVNGTAVQPQKQVDEFDGIEIKSVFIASFASL